MITNAEAITKMSHQHARHTAAACPLCSLRSAQAYTLSDVLKWSRQLVTAITCLSNARLVHGSIDLSKLYITASGDLVLLGAECAQGQGNPLTDHKALRGAFVAPESRQGGSRSGIGTGGAEVYLARAGDVWSLGVVAYVLGLRKDPRAFDHDPAKAHEVDAVAARADAGEWLHAKLLQAWPDGKDDEQWVLAKVIGASLRKAADARLPARMLAVILGPGELLIVDKRPSRSTASSVP